MPVMDAMSCGIPVVAASSAALPWTVGEAGLTFPPADDAALADILTTLLGLLRMGFMSPIRPDEQKPPQPSEEKLDRLRRTSSIDMEGAE